MTLTNSLKEILRLLTNQRLNIWNGSSQLSLFLGPLLAEASDLHRCTNCWFQHWLRRHVWRRRSGKDTETKAKQQTCPAMFYLDLKCTGMASGLVVSLSQAISRLHLWTPSTVSPPSHRTHRHQLTQCRGTKANGGFKPRFFLMRSFGVHHSTTVQPSVTTTY